MVQAVLWTTARWIPSHPFNITTPTQGAVRSAYSANDTQCDLPSEITLGEAFGVAPAPRLQVNLIPATKTQDIG